MGQTDSDLASPNSERKLLLLLLVFFLKKKQKSKETEESQCKPERHRGRERKSNAEKADLWFKMGISPGDVCRFP